MYLLIQWPAFAMIEKSCLSYCACMQVEALAPKSCHARHCHHTCCYCVWSGRQCRLCTLASSESGHTVAGSTLWSCSIGAFHILTEENGTVCERVDHHHRGCLGGFTHHWSQWVSGGEHNHQWGVWQQSWCSMNGHCVLCQVEQT